MGTAPFGASTKVPNAAGQVPKQRLSAVERLHRLEEAKVFLRQRLADNPQPARTLLQAAKAAGIAERTLHRAKDLLGITTERTGGYAEQGQWIWYPPAPTVASTSPASPPVAALSPRR